FPSPPAATPLPAGNDKEGVIPPAASHVIPGGPKDREGDPWSSPAPWLLVPSAFERHAFRVPTLSDRRGGAKGYRGWRAGAPQAGSLAHRSRDGRFRQTGHRPAAHHRETDQNAVAIEDRQHGDPQQKDRLMGGL